MRRKVQTANIEASSLSASQRVYADVRRRILALEWPPGARVVELEIAAHHGVSRTPVHEALQRLAEEGLVEIFQRVGTFVSRIPVDELEEAMLARTALEVALVEKAASRIQRAHIDLLGKLLEQQRQCATNDDYTGFLDADDGFHAFIADIAGCPRIWRTINQIKTQIDRLRLLMPPSKRVLTHTLEEHVGILKALADGNIERAKQAMRDHLDQVLPSIGLTRALRPDYFVNRSITANEVR